MSLEYAMEGRFSEKSDVFTFGVLLLEMVSGRRNTSFCQDEKSMSLLGFVSLPSLISLFLENLQCFFLVCFCIEAKVCNLVFMLFSRHGNCGM